MASALTLFWFRRDLRFNDNQGLARACASGFPVAPLFIFDTNILKNLERDDARVTFISDALEALRESFRERGGELAVFHGRPLEILESILKSQPVKAIYANEDYEPYARERDAQVAGLANKHGVEFRTFKDQVIFAPGEIAKDDGEPYRVFTPYYRRWKESLRNITIPAFASSGEFAALKSKDGRIAAGAVLKEIGFSRTALELPPRQLSKAKISAYAKKRDLLALDATTHLGVHLRFGTLSVRQAVRAARSLSETWLKELAWREFFMQVLYHHPRTVSEPFDERFANVKWINDKEQFQSWCEGRTGYPVVDAGMRELNATGFMHNRARMIAGSFLTKHLLIDWRWGERYFASKLLDFELASNVGNWQWVAGCGCDAAPYFRIFNPALQAKKFDSNGEYVKRWVREAGSPGYTKPIVDHETARKRAIVTLNRAVKGK
jgi:deoxyribodipyrimidine photo-lyase